MAQYKYNTVLVIFFFDGKFDVVYEQVYSNGFGVVEGYILYPDTYYFFVSTYSDFHSCFNNL